MTAPPSDPSAASSSSPSSSATSSSASSTAVDDYIVPPDAPHHDCDRCEATFATERHLALHRGTAHRDERLTDAERTAYREARETETAELRRFRIVALGALVAVYFALLFAYALVT